LGSALPLMTCGQVLLTPVIGVVGGPTKKNGMAEATGKKAQSQTRSLLSIPRPLGSAAEDARAARKKTGAPNELISQACCRPL
jgi:hypothetical protein